MAQAASRPRSLAALRRVLRVTVRLRLLPSRFIGTYARLELRTPSESVGLELAWEVVCRVNTGGSSSPIDRRIQLRLCSAMRRHGAAPEETHERAVNVIAASPNPARDAGVVVHELLDDGDVALAESVVATVGLRMDESQRLLLERTLAVGKGDDKRAAELEHELAALPGTGDEIARMRVDRWIGFGHQRAIASAWSAPEAPHRPPADVAARAFLFLGDTSSAAEALATGNTNAIAETLVAVERHALIGDVNEAVRLVRRHLGHVLGNPRLLRAAAEVLRRAGDRGDDEIRGELRRPRRLGLHQRGQLVVAYSELGDTREVLEASHGRDTTDRLGHHARYAVAQALYVTRAFDDATEVLRGLRGTPRHADALKLLGRILFERGQFDAALDQRRRHGRPSELIDEVVFHGLLQHRDYDAAFGTYCNPSDRRRLQREFPDTAVAEIADRPATRFVICQAGPGDEIQLASTYAAALARSTSLAVTSDVRLAPLVARSFPELEVIPVERRTRHLQWDFLAPGKPDRSGDDLSDLMTTEARALAADADELVLGRDLARLTSAGGATRPAAPYLRSSRARMAVHRRWLSEYRPAVGIVWRSEFQSLMRSIHYLELEEIQPIFDLDVTFVCLQDDISPREQQELRWRTGSRVRFPTQVDLRDDLEDSAALVAVLDAVVGVGTTLVELAGAVGTPTVMMQPTHFGSWRSTDGLGQDFWHQSVRVATISQTPDRAACVATAASLLSESLPTG